MKYKRLYVFLRDFKLRNFLKLEYIFHYLMFIIKQLLNI